MARDWKDVRTEARATGKLDEERIAELGRRMRAEVRAYRLVEIRETLGLSQSDVAERIGVSQPLVSRIERGEMDDAEVATIRASVGALGGEVEIVAKFGDERITVG
jgi:ribosome-binding protein aMBF1 (putative translation factor)